MMKRKACVHLSVAAVWGLALLAVGAAVTPASAADVERTYITRGGEAIPITISSDELAVRLAADESAAATSKRLSRAGLGVLEDVPGHPASSFKLLYVADTKAAHRNKLRADAGVAEVYPVYHVAGSSAPLISTGSIVLKVQPGLTDEQRDELFSEYRVKLLAPYAGLPDVYLVAPLDKDQDELLRASALAMDERLAWAQPNLRRPSRPRQVAVDDPFYANQWHLNNTGVDAVQDADIDAPEAWLIAEGADVLFGVFDDAVDVDHPDLRDGYAGSGQDVALPSNDSGYSDPRPKIFGDEHGTAVLGLACAQANSFGVRGVSYLSRFTASRGLGELLTDAEVASTFTFARQENVDVHINSWGREGPNSAIVEEEIVTAFQEGRDERGMVIVFASGNDGIEVEEGRDYSMIPQVIGIGASNSLDVLATYSNWGTNINLLAPSGDDFLTALATTDVSDAAGYPEVGYNFQGFSDDLDEIAELGTDGNYTKYFSGTSGACPIAAGVAGLILSRNPLLTATDVRVVLEHTADKIDAEVAEYNGITSRSEKYGYGRINAQAALAAAEIALTTGRTWPDRPNTVQVNNTLMSWDGGTGTDEFLVLESESEFGFIPEDGVCYDCDQAGCSSGGECDEDSLAPLPNGVSILLVGPGTATQFEPPVGDVKYFGIYGRSNIGRYSFGVAVDSDGNVSGGSTVVVDEPDTPIFDPTPPAVTLFANPLQGESPLTVTFSGNAVSSFPIDETQTAWDFDISDTTTVNTRERFAAYTYEVDPGQTRTFVARLTMFDTSGASGSAQVSIVVDGGGVEEGPIGENEVKIIVSVPGTVGSDVSSGVAPFTVELSIDADALAGTLESVFWDLGDGTTARSIVVPHTFENDTEQTLVYPVTATVTTTTATGVLVTNTASRLVQVLPSGQEETGDQNENLNGTGATGGGAASCGVLGLLPMLGMLLPLAFLKLRRDR
jgi:subtilisin family serine protease/PKD repeat protein